MMRGEAPPVTLQGCRAAAGGRSAPKSRGSVTAQQRSDTYYVSILPADSSMILSFRCKETERIWQGRPSRKFPTDIQERALRKLRQLDASRGIEDLKNP